MAAHTPSSTVSPNKTKIEQFQWSTLLCQNPDKFKRIQLDIQKHYANAASLHAASILADVTQSDDFKQTTRHIRDNANTPSVPPEKRSVRMRLLSGLVVIVTTLYCPPKRQTRKDGQQNPRGIYPEFAALGVALGCSPAVAEKIARTVAMTPSIRLARAELKAQDIQLDTTTVRRVAEQFGELLLALRRRDVLAFRDGTLARTRDLAGRRVVMQIDGGRIRIRKSGKKKGKNARRKFKTKWREPKVLTIFTIDESGKMERKDAFRLIDGSLQGPDHLAELTACHLWRLGQARRSPSRSWPTVIRGSGSG